MGNTMIQDSTTGNIMGLRDGFVPVGMKEYGGILYIASYNQKTGEGQLGTIPSPVFNYTYKDPEITTLGVQISDIDSTNLGDSLLDGVPYYKYYKDPIKMSDTRMMPGDQFIIVLELQDNKKIPTISRPCIKGTVAGSKSKFIDIEISFPVIDSLKNLEEITKFEQETKTPTIRRSARSVSGVSQSANNFVSNLSQLDVLDTWRSDYYQDEIDIKDLIKETDILDTIDLSEYSINLTKEPSNIELVYYNLITGFDNGDIPDCGLLKFILEAKTERSSSTIEVPTSHKRQNYYIEENLEVQISNYWFILSRELGNNTLDSERCQADDCFRAYPNILPGYLYIRVKPELPSDFNFILNKSTGIYSPNVFVITE